MEFAVAALRRMAWIAAFGIAVLLGLVWTCSALMALQSPLFDIGRQQTGDLILAVARFLELSPDGALKLARMLVAAELVIGGLLLCAPIIAACEYALRGRFDDALFDVAMLVSVLGTSVALIALSFVGGKLLQAAIGELVLSIVANLLASFARGGGPIGAEQAPGELRTTLG